MPHASELTEAVLEQCLKAAREASRAAYCPYSKFPVGAAILADDGAIHAGCNVENASYGLTMCAERNAIFRGVTSGMKRIRAVVIFTPTRQPTAPCGACRQVINEFGSQAEVISFCEGDAQGRWHLSQLLVDAFGPHNL